MFRYGYKNRLNPLTLTKSFAKGRNYLPGLLTIWPAHHPLYQSVCYQPTNRRTPYWDCKRWLKATNGCSIFFLWPIQPYMYLIITKKPLLRDRVASSHVQFCFRREMGSQSVMDELEYHAPRTIVEQTPLQILTVHIK